eukprot:SAG31_NODE_1650_length_7635_cov_12.658705_3_plen_91_part_00
MNTWTILFNISMTATASVRVSPVSLVISADQWNAPHQKMLDLLETGFPGGMQAEQIQHSFGSLDLTYGDYPDQYFPLSIITARVYVHVLI